MADINVSTQFVRLYFNLYYCLVTALKIFPPKLQTHLEPYTKLYQIAYKWQRAEKKYMDGDFNLDGEEIDTETEEYFKELYKLQKLFKNRIKAQKQQEAEAKHVPLSVLYDEDNLENVPPPLKICNTALDSLTEFRVKSNKQFWYFKV